VQVESGDGVAPEVVERFNARREARRPRGHSLGDDGRQDVIGVIVAVGAGAVGEDAELRYAGRRITCPSDGARTGDAAQTASLGGMMVLVFADGLDHTPA